MSDTAPAVVALQQRIALLEQENVRLAEQAEDMLLFGLVHEAVAKVTDPEQILALGLERIFLLKDIAICASAAVRGDTLQLLAPGHAIRGEIKSGSLIGLNGFIPDLSQPVCLQGEDLPELGLPLSADETVTEILMIPFAHRFEQNGLFLFVAADKEPGMLSQSSGLLQRIVDAMLRRIDHTLALDELKQLNIDLDARVEARTRALKEQEGQYHSLINQAMDGIFVIDIDSGRFLEVNAAACNALGYQREELLSLGVCDIVEGWTKDRFAEEMHHLQLRGTMIAEGEHRCCNGGTFPVETHLGMILFNGRVSALAISHDISDRKLSEERLSRAHALLDGVVNGIPDLIFYKDSDGIYLGCNQAFCRFVGKSEPSEVQGLNDYEMFEHDLADFFRSKDAEMLQTMKARRNEEWVTYPDGKEVLLDTLKTPFFGPDGSVLGLIGISRDITEHRRTEDQLLQAQKMEGIGTLVGGIAHDFNNMLAGMMGHLYIIGHDTALSSNTRDKIEHIHELCERAANMIAQLLTFARKGMISMQPLNVVPFLRETLEMVEVGIPENIRITHSISVDQATLMGDTVQLQQMLLNLLVNARDAVLGAHDPEIGVTVTRIEPDAGLHERYQGLAEGPWIELAVHDNGCGIPESIRDQLYEPFFTTKEVGEGTGLGLSTVYGVVQAHQGAIAIESELHRGATFRVYLPLIGEQAEQIERASDRLPHGDGETVLLVDDEEIVRSTTSELLRHMGYQVITARDGRDALSKEGVESVDIALLDVVMPEMGGVETAQRLREINPHLPILFATAYDRHLVLSSQDRLPNSRILSKPFRLKELANAVAEALSPG